MEPRFLATPRLRIRYLDTHGDNSAGKVPGETLVLLHGNLASCKYFEPLAQALSSDYRCIAPDIRGYGLSDARPIRAAAGLADCSDDLLLMLDMLKVENIHLLGWSLGGGIAMRFAIDHCRRLRSLTLVAPVSPYGYGGTRDAMGAPIHPDWAGSGGGLVAEELVQMLQDGAIETLRQSLGTLLVAKGTVPDHLLQEARLQARGAAYYPGDAISSPNWPGFSPGEWGAMNAMSPKHFNTSPIANIADKPPILWLRGDQDAVISDHSPLDCAVLGCEQQIPDWPGESDYPPQPMLAQTRQVLEAYAAQGGAYQELVLPETGHTPMLEAPEQFESSLRSFLDSA
ncbi:MAG: alpha/beta fold hydrolase [Pseudomonadales bacterium]